MNVWRLIADNSWVLILIVLVWGLGVIIGSKFGKIKVIFLKNPFKGSTSSFKDDTPDDATAIRYKREYRINLIVNNDADVNYDAIADFTFKIEDLIEAGKFDVNKEEENLKFFEQEVKGKSMLVPQNENEGEYDPMEGAKNKEDDATLKDQTEDLENDEAVLSIEDVTYFLPSDYFRQ